MDESYYIRGSVTVRVQAQEQTKSQIVVIFRGIIYEQKRAVEILPSVIMKSSFHPYPELMLKN